MRKIRERALNETENLRKKISFICDMYLAQHTGNMIEKSLYEMLTIYRYDTNTMFIFHRIK